jgi:ABC-type uncharacterized transport system substrate-binding protein
MKQEFTETRGENPANIPFHLYSKNKLLVNPEAARAVGLELPLQLIKRAEEVTGR